ncbi:hypothetical protein RvY_05364-3 [Ramazzottius varieornatus]|uniref:Late endosomal/lysosomal adaptor and MAPK and MTOR activator 5 n=1 Tax=Ramazzottius varieornatus TaxID=947166 RepID=A0A1D1UUT5_RAMVA|nr:hypothetical protein RvY_05364-3 [Ramazzottius varieornatus]
MEAQLEKNIREVMNQPQVTGAMCIDRKGLCLTAKGNADSSAAGFLSEISKFANQIVSSDGDSPVVALEYSKSQILLKGGESVCTVIYKEKQQK